MEAFFQIFAQSETGIVTMLVSAIGAMGSAVAYLHHRLMKEMEELREALRECQADRESLWMALASQKHCDVNTLKKKFGSEE